ncbi:MAG TPA: hypothetical protein VGD89_01170 [Flavipsychrobacter sp.]
MKQWLHSLIVIITLLYGGDAFAQQKSEEALVNKILFTLARQDDSAYAALFPKYEELVKLANSYTSDDVISTNRINQLRSNLQAMQQFDPAFNPEIIADFKAVNKKGIDSGLHWRDMLLARYELEKAYLPKELIGFERVVPYRLRGYIFVQDLLTRRTFCVTVKDIHGYNNVWYGGRVVNVLEAETIDEYQQKLAAEIKVERAKLTAMLYPDDTAGAASDSAALLAAAAAKQKKAAVDDDEEEKKLVVTEVVERKLYTGKFDNELKVELYVRGLRGSCAEPVCAWQAIYRFQDSDEYIKLDVTRSPDGKFIFTEEDIGVMEVAIKAGKVTGEWTSFKDKTEYIVDLTEKQEVKGRKLLELDTWIESSDNDD